MTPSQLLAALFEPMPAGDDMSMRDFLRTWGPEPRLPAHLGLSADHNRSAFARLVWVALRASRRATASAAGHQAAIRRLFPETPVDAVTAFCISEDHGPRPSKIFTTLTQADDRSGGWVLNGSKRWASMSPNADILYVAASIDRTEARNHLRMVRLAADRDGVGIDTTPYADKYGEMGIANLSFADVRVGEDEVIDADAYESYIKPFRIVEDVYNTAGTQIGLLRLGLNQGWPDPVLEDLTGLIMQAATIAHTPMAEAPDIVLIASYFRQSRTMWDELAPCWDQVAPNVRAAWSPETGLLDIAAQARETRRRNAWEEIAGQWS